MTSIVIAKTSIDIDVTSIDIDMTSIKFGSKHGIDPVIHGTKAIF